MLKRILYLFLFLSFFSGGIVAKEKAKKQNEPESSFIKYEVKSKETIFSLCRRYQVTEAELLELNPSLVNGLKSGQVLLIPVKKQETEQKTEVVEPTKLEEPLVREEPKQESHRANTVTGAYRPRITLLLPFAESQNTSTYERYVEFYEGFLLAVDSLKSLGLSFEVQALESGVDAESLSKQIDSGKLNGTDYCVGGVSSEQIALLSDWGKTNMRYVILPFSSRVQGIEENQYLYQTITPHTVITDRMTSYLTRSLSGAQFVFLGKNEDVDDYRSDFLKTLKNGLKSKGLRYVEVAEDENMESLGKFLSTTRQNVILPAPSSLQETGNTLLKLDAYFSNHPEFKTALVGYPDWIALGKTYQKHLFKLNTTIYSSFYADVTKKNVQNFQVHYHQMFDKNLLNIYPKYGMMGYDIAAFFIPKIVRERIISKDSYPQIEPLQNAFNFVSTTPQSGQNNRILYLIRFTPDNDVKVDVLK
jgi:LysM repeat protein